MHKTSMIRSYVNYFADLSNDIDWKSKKTSNLFIRKAFDVESQSDIFNRDIYNLAGGKAVAFQTSDT